MGQQRKQEAYLNKFSSIFLSHYQRCIILENTADTAQPAGYQLHHNDISNAYLKIHTSIIANKCKKQNTICATHRRYDRHSIKI